MSIGFVWNRFGVGSERLIYGAVIVSNCMEAHFSLMVKVITARLRIGGHLSIDQV
jgi:hypothetical protein